MCFEIVFFFVIFRFRFRQAFVASPPVSSTAPEIIQSPEADTSAPPPPPITIHLRKNCKGGPLIDATQLPTTVDDVTPGILAKKLVNQILTASHKAETILARLGALCGEEMVITHGGNTFTIKLPTLSKASDLENVFSTLSQTLGCCHNMFGKFLIMVKDVFSFVVLKIFIVLSLSIGAFPVVSSVVYLLYKCYIATIE